MSRIVSVSPGAAARGYTVDAASPLRRLAHEARRLRDTVRDAEASAPLAPIQQLHQRLGEAEKAIAWLCLAEPDAAGGSRDPESGDDTDGEPTGDRRRRSRDNIGARSWSKGGQTGYEETDDGDPDSDVHPPTEQARVASSLKFQNAKNDGNNVRADGSGGTGDELPDTPADINNKNRQFWKTPKSARR